MLEATFEPKICAVFIPSSYLILAMTCSMKYENIGVTFLGKWSFISHRIRGFWPNIRGFWSNPQILVKSADFCRKIRGF